MLDLLIHGGEVVDGSGRPRRRLSVGVRDGRIVALGGDAHDEPAKQSIDATGKVVCPGFIDVHTHYDAQVMWDPWATPSSLNGVTTILAGNCGFTIAPMAPSHADYLLGTLARVEGMSLDALEAGLDMGWSSFGDWLSRLDGRLGVNAGFSVGHSTLRRIVMGERSGEPSPTDVELSEMCSELHRALEAGALGFSSSWGSSHFDRDGGPVPSRKASADELVVLSSVLAQYPGTTLEFLPTTRPTFGPDQYEVMIRMAGAAKRRLNWNLIVVRPGEHERAFRSNQLEASDAAGERGVTVKCLTLPQPMRMRLSLLTGVLYDTTTGWFDVLHLPVEQRLRALEDTSVRERLAAGALADGYHDWTDWANCSVADVADPSLKRFVGQTFGAIGAQSGVDPFNAMLDLLLADRLRAGIAVPVTGGDDESWQERVSLLCDERVIAGGSDAGAHLDMTMTWACYVELLATAVRERELLTLEEAVQLVTAIPADFWGLVDRGRVVPGACADLVILDHETVGPGDTQVRRDLPGDGWRLYSEATGISHTFVNGIEIVSGGELTGELPGAVLRSGVNVH